MTLRASVGKDLWEKMVPGGGVELERKKEFFASNPQKREVLDRRKGLQMGFIPESPTV